MSKKPICVGYRISSYFCLVFFLRKKTYQTSHIYYKCEVLLNQSCKEHITAQLIAILLSSFALSLSFIWSLHALELCHASHLWQSPLYNAQVAYSALQHLTASPVKEGCHCQAGRDNNQTCRLAIPALNLYQLLLWLTSSKRVQLALQQVHIQSSWMHIWTSDTVVNSHLVSDPRIPQRGFNQRQSVLVNVGWFATSE